MAKTSFARIVACLSFMIFLAGCGGGGNSSPPVHPGLVDTVASADVTSSATFPITHDYAKAGTYTLTLTGQYTVIGSSGPDRLAVWFSFGGQGTLTGASQPNYTISATGQVINISQEVTLDATGAGPWKMQILCFTGGSAGTLTNLTLTSVLN